MSLIIYFAGMDGSGKTALSSSLYRTLRDGHNVSYKWWFDGNNTLLRQFIRLFKHKFFIKNLKRQTSNNNVSKKFTTSYLLKYLFPRIVILDYIFFGLKQHIVFNYINKSDIIIFDRYIYDILFALVNEFNSASIKGSFLYKICFSLFPIPDIIFFIEVDPEISLKRKPEEIKSLENSESMWRNYQTFYLFLSTLKDTEMKKIDNSQEIELAEQEIIEFTLDYWKYLSFLKGMDIA